MPPFTVASLATITHSRPLTTPIPVTIPAAGRFVVVEAVGREGAQLEERRLGVEQPLDPLAGEELPARRRFTPPRRLRRAPPRPSAGEEVRDERLHALPVRAELRSGRVGSRLENRHGASTEGSLARSSLRPAQHSPSRAPSRRGRLGAPRGPGEFVFGELDCVHGPAHGLARLDETLRIRHMRPTTAAFARRHIALRGPERPQPPQEAEPASAGFVSQEEEASSWSRSLGARRPSRRPRR